MPILLIAFIVRVIVEMCRIASKRRQAKPRPLCTECAHAHIQYATSKRTAISCTFAGTVRPVAIDVMYCTDYRDRNAAPRVVSIGFVHEIEETQSVAEVAAAGDVR